MRSTKKAGFTSVFIVMIFSSIMAVMILFIEISLDRGADSIAETITTNAGSSVLTECSKPLHDEYGILAFKNDTSRLSNIAEYYISESIDGINRFVHLGLDAVIVETAHSGDLYLNEFKQQVVALGKKNLVFQNRDKAGLSSFSGVNLPSQTVYALSAINPLNVLNQMNGYYSPGAGLFVTQYAMSNFTVNEIEYMIFGGLMAYENEQSTRNTIFAIRCIINCVEEIEDPILWIEAIARANAETDRIMQNEEELRQYLMSMVFVISSSNALILRMMDVIQLSLGNGFYFKDYAYSFTITAQYSRGEKKGVYTQEHSWT